jgi:peptidoglycan hydrolase-like protein with peptidoglycan-binding domain
MNKIFSFVLLGVIFTNYSMAQNAVSNFDWFNTGNNIITPTTYNNSTATGNYTQSSQSIKVNQSNQLPIPQNVLIEINNLRLKYNFNQSQVNALNQIARSYQYIINNTPRNTQDAFVLSARDVAAINCASSRISDQGIDDSINRIELASLDTEQKRNSYFIYSNLLGEDSSNPQIIDSCEDEFSPTPNPDNTFQINLNGIIPDQNITSKCLILTRFMEFGSRDSQVFPLQNFLMENGYLEMYPTGFFGRNTEFAVKEWQKRHNVDVRGWVGPNTRGSIAGVTCKNQASFEKAFKGEAVKKSIVPTIKKVTTNTTEQQIKEERTVIIPNTNSEAVNFNTNTFTNTVSSNNLSSSGSTFFLKRSPINTLYFTYKANTSLDDVYTCISKKGDSRCDSSNNFIKVKQKYEPGNMDMINNNTRWIFNVYYSPEVWGSEGGNIYIRNGLGNISEVYSVKVANTL